MNLREWAIKNKIWTKKAWFGFLNDYLEPLYVDLYNISEFHSFLKKLYGKMLSDIKDDDLRERIKVALLARGMFDNFGLRVAGSTTFEESIESYENQMYTKDVKIEVHVGENWDALKADVEELIVLLIEKTSIPKKQLMMITFGKDDDIKIAPKPEYIKNPRKLLPNSSESLTELDELLKNLRKHSLDLAIGKNSYTTFVYYIRTIKADYLKEFLGCGIKDLKKLVEILGLDVMDIFTSDYAEIDKTNIERLILCSPEDEDKITTKTFNMLDYIERIYTKAKETKQKMIITNMKTQKIEFKPWKGFYREIFLLLRRNLKEGYDECNVYFHLSNSRNVEEIYICEDYEYEILPKVKVTVDELLDVITKLSAIGIADLNYYKYDERIELSFNIKSHDMLKFLNRVIAFGGKTKA